jgi:hypothetical protein
VVADGKRGHLPALTEGSEDDSGWVASISQWCCPPRRQQAGSWEAASWAKASGPISEKLNRAISRIAEMRRIRLIVHPWILISVCKMSKTRTQWSILMHMRTTLVIDDGLLQRAKDLSGVQEKNALVHAGLEALIARKAGKRLAALGATQPKISRIFRRRLG